MDKRDRYDEIDNLITTLDILIGETESEDIIDDLKDIKYKYYDERDELETKIIEEENAEEREREREWYNSRL